MMTKQITRVYLNALAQTLIYYPYKDLIKKFTLKRT